MATKDNFMKALKELTGFDEEPAQNAGANTTVAPGAPVKAQATLEPEKPQMPPEVVIPAVKVAESPVIQEVQNPVIETPKPVDINFVKEMEPVVPLVIETPKIAYDLNPIKSASTKITENMVVIGNVKSSDRIDVTGRVRGDVETTEDIVLEGVVEGGLKGKNMLLQGCALKGNILATGDVAIEEGTVVVGNVQAENVKLDGKIKGNLFVSQMTQLTSNALLLGDIETTGIASSIGSRIRGNIITKRLDDVADDIDFDVEV